MSGGGGSGFKGGKPGGGSTGGYQHTSGHASSITPAGIANGVLILEDGSGEGIACGVIELQKGRAARRRSLCMRQWERPLRRWAEAMSDSSPLHLELVEISAGRI